MKKLILGLALIAAGCGYAPLDHRKPIKILKVKNWEGNSCKFYVTGSPTFARTWTDPDSFFIDTCGKFQPGDTICIMKK